MAVGSVLPGGGQVRLRNVPGELTAQDLAEAQLVGNKRLYRLQKGQVMVIS